MMRDFPSGRQQGKLDELFFSACPKVAETRGGMQKEQIVLALCVGNSAVATEFNLLYRPTKGKQCSAEGRGWRRWIGLLSMSNPVATAPGSEFVDTLKDVELE